MNWFKVFRNIFLLIVLFAFSIVAQSEWSEDSFEDFKDGSFLDAGSNAYVSAKGRIQIITRWDFNNDGNLDIFIASGHGHTEKENTYIYLNNGEDIDARSRIELPAAGSYDGLITDFNKDGLNDLAIVNNSDSHVDRVPVWIYMGSKEGFLVENRIELPSESGTDIAIGDFNNDSWTDIAVACQFVDDDFDTPISMIYWNSATGFNAENRLPFSLNGRGAIALASGDVDSDGLIDLIAVTAEKSFLFLSTKNDFENADNISIMPIQGKSVDLGDYNDDGHLDLLLCVKKKVVVIKGNGLGEYSLDDEVILEVSNPSDAQFADVDKDGLNDVVVANFASPGGATWTDSYIFYSDGKDFTTREPLEIPTIGARSVSCEDLNNDGFPEIVFSFQRVTNQNNILSYIYWNDKGTFRYGNHTQLPTQGTVANTVGDVNNDGMPDVVFFNDEGYFRDGPAFSHIYWGSGERNFSASRSSKLFTHQIFGFGHADLDDDGSVDLILEQQRFIRGVEHEQGGIILYWGDNGSFEKTTNLTMLTGYGGVRIADINKDGFLDIMGGGYSIDLNEPTLHGFPIFWGSKNGYSFRNQTVLHFKEKRFRAPLLMDLNKDGFLDIAGQVENGKIRIWWGGELGLADSQISDIDLGNDILLMYIKGADFNNDGWLDLVLPQRGPPDGTLASSIILYGSQNGYNISNSAEVNSYVPYQNSIADLNKDGWLDLLLTSYGGEVSGNRPALIHWGSKNGFLPEYTELENYGGSGSEILDYDGDGWLDILIANHRKAGSYLVPKPHEHTTQSMLYWGSPNGFSEKNRWEVVASGPSGLNLRDAGNSYDRGLYEDYISSINTIAESEVPASINWKAETPFGTEVHFQLRTSENESDLSQSEWVGPNGTNSWFTESGSEIQSVSGKFIQYRARLITPNGAATPYLTSVTISFENR